MSATVVVHFQAQPGQRGALAERLEDLQRDMQRVNGLFDIQLFLDEDDPDACWEIEHWSRADDHRVHMRNLASSGALDELGELLTKPPAVHYLQRT